MRVAAEEVKKAEEKELRRNKDMDEYLEKRRKGEIRPNDQVGCQASPCNPETLAPVAASDTQCLPLYLGPAISSPLSYLLSSPLFDTTLASTTWDRRKYGTRSVGTKKNRALVAAPGACGACLRTTGSLVSTRPCARACVHTQEFKRSPPRSRTQDMIVPADTRRNLWRALQAARWQRGRRAAWQRRTMYPLVPTARTSSFHCQVQKAPTGNATVMRWNRPPTRTERPIFF